MSTIHTAEELDELPVRKQVTDSNGCVWTKDDPDSWSTPNTIRRMSVTLAEIAGPFEIVPDDQPATGAPADRLAWAANEIERETFEGKPDNEYDGHGQTAAEAYRDCIDFLRRHAGATDAAADERTTLARWFLAERSGEENVAFYENEGRGMWQDALAAADRGLAALASVRRTPVQTRTAAAPSTFPVLESVRREALLEYVREARKNPGSSVWEAEDVFADIEDWATRSVDDEPATAAARALPSAEEALADLSTLYNAESGSREKDDAAGRLFALLSAAGAPAGQQPTLAELADELEYRVRTAVALAKGGNGIDAEVQEGRKRITALGAWLLATPVKKARTGSPRCAACQHVMHHHDGRGHCATNGCLCRDGVAR